MSIEHSSQHTEAIAKTIRVRNEVSADFFDDKIRTMGSVKVENGIITVNLESFPSLMDDASTGEFIAASISLAIKVCWAARKEAFEKMFLTPMTVKLRTLWLLVLCMSVSSLIMAAFGIVGVETVAAATYWPILTAFLATLNGRR